MDYAACEVELDELWMRLKHDARAVNFASLLRMGSANANPSGAADGVSTAAADSLFVNATGTAFTPLPTPVAAGIDTAATDQAVIGTYLDGYALDTRIDAVDEKGTPFVPFVKPLTLREFELLSYGVLLNTEHRTLLLRHDYPTSSNANAGRPDGKYHDAYLVQLRSVRFPAPVAPAKAEDAAAATTDAEATADAPAASDSPAAAAAAPADTYRPALVPLFRLRFRRGHDHEETGAHYAQVGGRDSVYLVSVFVTGHRFGSVHDDTRTMVATAPSVEYYDRMRADNCDAIQQRQEAWAAWTKYTSNSLLSDPRDGDKARRQGDRTCGYDVEGAGQLEEVDEAVLPHAPPSSRIATGEDFIPRTCRYPHDRMASRILVVERGSNKMLQWAALCAELGLVLPPGAPGAAEDEVVPDNRRAVRVVWKETRNGANTLHDDSGEMTAYLPGDDEVDRLSVYNTPAEEQLRLWAAKALSTAEARGDVKQVLLHADLALLVGRCTGLHSLRSLRAIREGLASGDAEDPVPASIAAREHALRVLIETAEDWVQGSGAIWRVVIMVDPPVAGDPSAWSALQVAQEELARVQQRKGGEESATPIAPSPTRNAVRTRKPRALHHDDVVTLSPARKGGSPARGYTDNTNSIALATQKVTLNDHVILHASISGVPVSDARLHELFSRLDLNKNGWLSRDELKRVFLKHTDLYDDVTLTERGTMAPRRTQDGYLSSGSVLNPLDACGLPFDDSQVDRYLARYCRQHKDRMTYPEFACMMLELARR